MDDLPPDSYPSKSRLTKLGERLARGDLTDDEREELEGAREYWNNVLTGLRVDVATLLVPFDVKVTGRLKNLGTIADKIRRDRTALPRMRDVVGCRVTAPDLDRKRQTEIVETLREAFDGSKPPTIVDRIADPRQGYRAIHLEITFRGVPAEIQVRTGLQHKWAELMERLGDRFGRGMRYGDYTVLQTLDPRPASDLQSVLQILDLLSDAISDYEKVDDTRADFESDRLAEARALLTRIFDELAEALDHLH